MGNRENENLQNKATHNQKEDKKTSHKVCCIIIGILILIIIFLCLRSCGCEDRNIDNTNNPVFDLTEDSNATKGGIEGKSKEEIQAELNSKVADGMINISMNLNPIFKDGSSEGNLLIVNEEINKYPQVIEIYLNDTEELIYKSGVIPVGSKVETGRLATDLDMGTYPCTAYFNAVNAETGELVGRAGASIEITVLE